MQKKRKKRHNFSIQYKIMGITLLPLLFLGVVVIVIAQTLVKNAMIDEVQSTLKSSAEAMYAAYDQNTGDYFQAKNGDVWKGGYNISQSSGMLDAFKKDANTEITFFYGDKRVVTTAKDKKGKRILGSPAGTRIKRQVLEKGENYFSTHVKINNTMYFGYYIPVYQDGSKTPIGMIFAGVEKNAKMQSIMLIIGTVVAFVLICMALGMIVAMLISMSISKSLKKSIQVVEKVSEGDLCVEIDAGLMKRKDEIGDLSISMNALKEKLKDSIETIKTNTQQVLQASSVLEDVSTNTVQSVNEVEQVVRQIAGNADNQAVMASEASDNVAIMGEKIQHTSSKVQQMRQQADNMQSAEKRALVTIDKLMNSNEQVQNLIRAIAMQTQQTNESANHIREAVDIISSIADETSLLSLNASIEAARAGEYGKGFAVVAEEIQKLATQSTESSEKINSIIEKLISDSNKAVEIMNQVTETILAQTVNMQETRENTEEVMGQITISFENMHSIEASVGDLDTARQELIATVRNLAEIAEQNAKTTQEVSANTNVVTEEFTKIKNSSTGLQDIAEELEVSTKYFSVTVQK